MKSPIRCAAFLLLVGVGSALGLVIAETLSRQFSSHSRSYMIGDPVLHHRLRTNDVRTVLGVEFRTNSLGLRDRKYSAEKAPGSTRILMLGDSFTEGGGLRSRPPCPNNSNRS